ncbi:MAG: hypothetical protein KAS11_00210 [Candidatus Aenigmarchaeota archaeon]|nr:hypothetical protein [Candidatus Aenigmarchaeota archaeon]
MAQKERKRRKPTTEETISAIEYTTEEKISGNLAEILRCKSSIPSVYRNTHFRESDIGKTDILFWRLIRYINYKSDKKEDVPEDTTRILRTIIDTSKDIFTQEISDNINIKKQSDWNEWIDSICEFNPETSYIEYKESIRLRDILEPILQEKFEEERKRIIREKIEKGHHSGYWILYSHFEHEFAQYMFNELPYTVSKLFKMIEDTEKDTIKYYLESYLEETEKTDYKDLQNVLEKLWPETEDPYEPQPIHEKTRNLILYMLKDLKNEKKIDKERMLTLVSDSFKLTIPETEQYFSMFEIIEKNEKPPEKRYIKRYF